jgi:DNA-binding response OmpR family regulator/anti-anti-sigma regulatory factor
MRPERGKEQLLIVEDDPTSMDMLDSALTLEGFDTVIANDGEMALSFAAREQPDLILLDVALPGIDGFEVCRRLKADPNTRDAPVVFMTGFDDARHRIKAFHAGGVDYISKPFEMEELLARLRTQLSIRSLTRALQEQNASLQSEIRDRAVGEAERAELTAELSAAKERLERELVERARTEAARAELQEQVIAGQRERLAELSTPLIPILDRIVVMPLIGAMDVERAQRVQETALRGAVARRAAFVILDITGMHGVDVSAADMLARTGAALRLLGARAVITGIGPAVAQMLVSHHGSLGELVTKATLQDGILYALRELRGRKRRLA